MLPDGRRCALISGYAEPGLERLNNDGWLDRLQKHAGKIEFMQPDGTNQCITGSADDLGDRVTGFAEGEFSQPSDKFVGGKSTMEKAVYFGPGTPPNAEWHHYTWTLVATDLDPKALHPGMTRQELAAALEDHVKGSAGLVTRFTRKPGRDGSAANG